MPELYLRKPGFTCSACGPFISNKERIQKCKQTADSRYFYQNELHKACFQHDMTNELVSLVCNFFDKKTSDSGIKKRLCQTRS